MSDSDEDMRSIMRAERIAEKSFNNDQAWPFDGGLSSSDDEWLENATRQEQSMVKTEWNRLRREWLSKQEPGYHIWKLVNKDGPKARAEIKKIFAANPDLDINKLFNYYSWGENKGKPDKRFSLMSVTKTLPMFKLFIELGYDLNNKKVVLQLLYNLIGHNNSAAKFILENVELDLNQKVIDAGGNKVSIVMDYYSMDSKTLNLLVKKGADINTVNSEGKTTLIIMNSDGTYYDRKKKTIFYLQNGADPNIQDNEGNTFLHYFKDILLKIIEDGDKGYSNWRYATPKTIEELFFGENIDPWNQRERDDLYNIFKHGANPFIKNKKGECVMDEPAIAKVYSRYMCDLINARQKLALASMLLPKNKTPSQNKERDTNELPEEIIVKIGQFLSLSKQVVDDIRGSELYQRFIRQELESSIRESYPGFNTDHLLELYQKELEKPGLPENTRQQYIKMIEKRLKKLGKEEMESRFRSRTRRNSRESRKTSTQNKSQRRSRTASLNSSEELKLAIAMEQELNEGRKAKKKNKKSKKIRKTKKR